ncbi:peptide chain release factor N(5)-glutamine methyltransferase [Lyngbya confervoides]|uniref:Release factor glutamine methyltransferase n=1 Tax=Lyngbya confervoides BDU141951 TaxID=1574623 RepID=A0ABD4SXJ1_9CYAN|nr:peptide chain release factor N(5)-glutamine methyltransferase [Lyngbya confervoides]MCM1981332.1 peptide chain release factor N(5)-glutamine methyltransferase [Lyngbya confervoides BDU141951]
MTVSPTYNVSGQDLWQWRQQQLQALESEAYRARQAHSPDQLAAELDWMLREVSGLDRLGLRLGTFRSRPQVPLARSLQEISDLWRQRLCDCVPVQYLLGQMTWRQFSLVVSPAVLIPRPETELLIDRAVDWVRQHPEAARGMWADLGTGSGAIALGLARELPEITVQAVEVSAEALAIAQRNIHRYELQRRIILSQGSWFTPLTAHKGQLQGVVSNPPYIPSPLLPRLQPEVVEHEPHLALNGGADGLDAVRHLVQQAHAYLRPGGLLLVEFMAGQGPQIAALLQAEMLYRDIELVRDWAGLDRFVQAVRV